MSEIFEKITQDANLQLNVKIPIKINFDNLLSDFNNVYSNFIENKQSGKYNDGGWKAIGLITSGGNVNEDRNKYAVGKPYIATPAMEFCPYIKELLDMLPAKKNRVRFMSLQPNSDIHWHTDGKDSIDKKLNSNSARFHIPLITSDKIEFKICHNRCDWQPGNLYYGDFSFPHRVKNNWEKKRIHLVIDLEPNDKIRTLFPDVFLKEENKRAILRNMCKVSYKIYSIKKNFLAKNSNL